MTSMTDTILPPVFYAYPGHVVKKGASDAKSILIIQQRLNELGCGPVKEDGVYGPKTEKAVKLFQIRFTDSFELPLKVDGIVGAMTWASIFGPQTVPVRNTTSNPLGAKIVEVATGEIGVREEPPYSNRGPKVDEYIKKTGLNPEGGKYAWCACFVYWCVWEASAKINVKNPALREAGVHNLWKKAKSRANSDVNGDIKIITADQALNDPGLLKPGMVFCLNRGGGYGHTGFVEEVRGGRLITIEGNTNASQSYTGGGVFKHVGRTISQIDLGFIEYISSSVAM